MTVTRLENSVNIACLILKRLFLSCWRSFSVRTLKCFYLHMIKVY